MLVKFEMLRSVTAALNRVVWPRIQLVMKAAVAPAGYAQPVAVDPWIFCENRIHAIHDVFVSFPAPIHFDRALEFLAVTAGAARIREEYGPSARRVDLKFVEPIDAIH